MAICTGGPLAGVVSGKVGSVVFVQSRYGAVVRKTGIRVDRRTESQLAVRARYEQVVGWWSGLSEGQREAWRAAAAGETFPNRLGVARYLSGFGLFVKVHMERWPSTLLWSTPPRIMLRVPAPTAVGVTASAAGEVRVQWTHSYPAFVSAQVISGARSVSDKARTFFKGWRNLGGFGKPAGSYNEVITGWWDAVLGHPIEGEVVSVGVWIWHADLLRSFTVEAQTVTVA